ncbi:hypothetical protein EIP91_001352 [Steccherinum ochraceum]|uniref:RecA family profile 1 domain-containing protein n=1 Tax=Steccherinum ochraceum TaxID=92696 RepID=A0A4R0RH44_9APHY|nr:hypothetical protein EIP91_001352 [Steccherinum ochraceum]
MEDLKTSDVFSLVSPNDVRRALYEAPENVATLIRVVTTRLFNLVSDHTFPTLLNASVASYATNLIKNTTGTQGRNTTKEVLNCLRLLQRVLPVIFEMETDCGRFELDVLWREVVEEEHVVEERAQESQFVIEDDEEDEEEAKEISSTPTTPKPSATTRKTSPSIAARLFSCLVDLLFCCGFTLPNKIQVDHYKINYTIWERGIGSTSDPGLSQPFENNRAEVLRLLLVLTSKQIYAPPSALFTSPSRYTLHFVQNTPRRDVLTILCSLINTAMNSTASSNTVAGVAGKLPYNHLVFKGEDPRVNLAGVCFRVLCVLLDFQSGSARDVTPNSAENPSPTPTARTNAFRYFVAKLHRASDFDFILRGVLGILEQQMASINNLLPGSRKSVPYIVETVMFFWKIVELNKKFRAYVLDSDRAMDVVAYILCYGLDIKDKPEQHGVCRAISYIVQSLSAEHAFGLKLASPLKVAVPQKRGTAGNGGDFLVNAIYCMIATTSGTLSSLYPAFVIALANSAPYFKHLNINASARLVQLFTTFASPSFLLVDEGHPRLLYFMLEVFNSVVLRNLADNPNLIYGIIRAHKCFEDLGTFTLASGLRDLKRQKEERERKKDGVDKGKQRADPDEGEEAHEEKARLLRHENNSLEALRRAESGEGIGLSETSSISSPPQSPTGPMGRNSAFQEGQSVPLSEKARGKMKAVRSLSIDVGAALEPLTVTGIGRNGFVPTQEWVTSWQQGLPLDPVLLMCSELLPKVSELQASLGPASASSAISDLLRSASLKDHLPPPPPLNPRRFTWSDASIVWLTSLIWGEIYVRGMSPLGVWNTTAVRLFYVKHTQTQPRQITDTIVLTATGECLSMDSLSISSLPLSLSPAQQTGLRRGGISSVSDLLLTPPPELAKKCRLAVHDIQSLVDAVCEVLASAPLRLDDEALQEAEFFTTGDQALDEVLGGGIRTGMLWEIVGESAAGKTQLSLQLSLCAQLPKQAKGAAGATCFLSTSWTLPTARILEIVHTHPSLSLQFCGLDDIHTLKTPTIPILLHVLSRTLPAFIEERLKPESHQKPVKLVVIDALTELFHSASKTSSSSLSQRAKDIAEISAGLHTLAAKHGIAVVVLNEVADVFDSEENLDSELQQGEVLYKTQSRWFSRAHTIPGENKKEAALGLTWANQVNARIMLSRTDRMLHLDNDDARASKRRRLNDASVSGKALSSDAETVRLRHLTVVFSSIGPPGSLDYFVSERGIVVIPDEQKSSVFSDPSPPFKPPGPAAVVAVDTMNMAESGTDSVGTQLVPSSQPSEQFLEIGAVAISSDDLGYVRSDEVEAEEGPQEEADDWEAYWKDDDLKNLYETMDFDAVSPSHPG